MTGQERPKSGETGPRAAKSTTRAALFYRSYDPYCHGHGGDDDDGEDHHDDLTTMMMTEMATSMTMTTATTITKTMMTLMMPMS